MVGRLLSPRRAAPPALLACLLACLLAFSFPSHHAAVRAAAFFGSSHTDARPPADSAYLESLPMYRFSKYEIVRIRRYGTEYLVGTFIRTVHYGRYASYATRTYVLVRRSYE